MKTTVFLFAMIFALALFWVNAWLLMWAWNILAAWFHLPLVKWIHGAAVLIILGCVRGVQHSLSQKEQS